MSRALAQAARDLLDAYAGQYPDHINAELVRLAQELAAMEAEGIGPAIACIEHMRAAEHYARRLSLPRVFRAIRDANEKTQSALGRAMLNHSDELAREAHRLAGLPDPLPEELEK